MSVTNPAALPPRLCVKKLVVIELDIRRAKKLISELDDEVARVLFIDGYYTLCSKHIEGAGGEVVKYMGDSCLATFPEDDCTEAINVVLAIAREFPDYCAAAGVTPAEIHGTVHVGDVIAGAFGPQGFKDVMGHTPSTLLTMAGDGITISEQVYRKLPSDQRSPWKKKGGKVAYVLK